MINATVSKKILERYMVPIPSVENRKEFGKALREKFPLEHHAQYRPSQDRKNPVAILEKQAKSRLQHLVPIRYARMLENPFAFLRGSAAVMAADLSGTPVTGLNVQACGDMHVANFGWFASAERSLVFGINDFDETLPGPWEWDLKRLVASAIVAGQTLGADKALCEEAARATVRSYRKRIREYAELSSLDVWYSRIDEAGIMSALSPEMQIVAKEIMSKSKTRGHTQVLEKMSELIDDRHRIIEDAPLIVREQYSEDGRPIIEALAKVLDTYSKSLPKDRQVLFARYRVIDVARKVVGVGCVGTRCWVILLKGSEDNDPLFLQFKEAQASVLAPYVRSPKWNCEGERVVVGQRLIQGAPDILLGFGIEHNGGHFYIRQLRDMKGSVEFKGGHVKGIAEYCKLCGWALALAHAKSGDPASIAGYLGKSESLDEAITQFGFAYAKQTEQDFDALTKAAKNKLIRVASIK